MRVTYLGASQRHRNAFSGSFVSDLASFSLGARISSFLILPGVWSGVLGHVLLAEVTQRSRIYQHHLLGISPKTLRGDAEEMLVIWSNEVMVQPLPPMFCIVLQIVREQPLPIPSACGRQMFWSRGQ